MKDLFISFGVHINVRNFIEGSIIHRELSAGQIAEIVEETRTGGAKVAACFDFGSVPSEKKRGQFTELGAAFEKMTGVHLPEDDFFFEVERGEVFPNFDFSPTVTDTMRMLVVQYYFEHQQGAEVFDDLFSVSQDTMNFHLFERTG